MTEKLKMKIRKCVSPLLVSVIVTTSYAVPVFADNSSNNDLENSVAAANSITVYLDGEQLDFDAEPEIVNGRTFVPMRAIFEALGADIEWSDSRREVVAKSGFDELVLKAGSKVAIHNTDAEMLDAAPYIKENRTMVPLRYLSESLNYDVQWNGTERRIDIKSDDSSENEPSSTGTGEALTVLGSSADLTYNTAMQKAIYHSSSCQSAKVELSKAERQSEDFNNLYSMNYNFTIMQNRKELKLLNDWSEKNVIVTEEQTAYSVTTEMDSISLKLADIKDQQDVLEYAKKKYETAKLRYETGEISAKTLNSALDDVTEAENTLLGYKTELEGLYISLYSSIGEDYPASEDSSGSTLDMESIIGDFMLPEFSVDYEPVGSVNIQEAYDETIANDPYIWYVENSEENADFKLTTYEYNVGGKSYALTKMDLQSARITSASTKKKFMKTLSSRYNQLLQLENNIDMLEDQLEILRDSIDTMRTLYENGMQSETALEDVLQNESTISSNIFKLQVQHEQLKTIFEKPYLAPEYMS